MEFIIEIATVVLIAVGLAIDAFAVSVANGAAIKDFNAYDSFKQGIFFGFFQFAMPIIGWILGGSVKEYIESIDHWIAFILLALIGLNMIKDSNEGKNRPEAAPKLTFKALLAQAVATSIDAMAVGVSFAIINIDIVTASVIIGIVAFLFSFFGGFMGKKLGDLLVAKAGKLGGAILFFIGIKILLEHL